MTQLAPSRICDYSHVFWRNGARKSHEQCTQQTLPNLLCFETGHYGLVIDVADLSSVRFGVFENEYLSYADCLLHGKNRRRMETLPQQELSISLMVDGHVYRALACKAAATAATGDCIPFNSSVLLWESGRLVQRIALQELEFRDENGETLMGIMAHLELVIWPSIFALHLALLNEASDCNWLEVGADMRLCDWNSSKRWSMDGWKIKEENILTLSCPLLLAPGPSGVLLNNVSISVATNERSVPVEYSEQYQCSVATAEYGEHPPKFVRHFKGGYTDIRDFDDFFVDVNNLSLEPQYVPFQLYIRNPANSTGMCPIVCTPTGIPTGIPIQISKNWHYRPLGAYARIFVFLPVQPEDVTSYLIRLVYGFYGPMPSASHAQLSLVGFRKYSGRWEQLAIGCFGETFCMDPETSCVANTVTDIRGLFLRRGKTGKRWNWTDCGWGGDWLHVTDKPGGSTLVINDMKTAYLCHGPCLTDVRYAGSYGDRRQVHFAVQVQTLRTDDCSRVLHSIEYKFNGDVILDGGWLLMSKTRGFVATSFAFGNKDCLVAEYAVADGLETGHVVVPDTTVKGKAPFWFSFPNSHEFKGEDKGTGTKHWVVRSFQADLDGSSYSNPGISCIVCGTNGPDKKPSLEMHLRPPRAIEEFRKGDSISLQVEWMTSPRISEDYYGTNAAFRDLLFNNPSSWKIPSREASGNDLDIQVEGGELQLLYPPRIQVTEELVRVRIHGGVGAVPVIFCGLPSSKYVLYQRVDGQKQRFSKEGSFNEFKQVEFSVEDGTFTITFNLLLDGQVLSVWCLKPS